MLVFYYASLDCDGVSIFQIKLNKISMISDYTYKKKKKKRKKEANKNTNTTEK